MQHGKEASWNKSGVSEFQNMKRLLKNDIIRPLNDLFSLQLGYESMDTGVSRNLSFYDYVSTFNRAKFKINGAGMKDKGLSSFSTDLLGFLGEGTSPQMISGHPLIAGLNRFL